MENGKSLTSPPVLFYATTFISIQITKLIPEQNLSLFFIILIKSFVSHLLRNILMITRLQHFLCVREKYNVSERAHEEQPGVWMFNAGDVYYHHYGIWRHETGHCASLTSSILRMLPPREKE